jgi:hypothetical protein
MSIKTQTGDMFHCVSQPEGRAAFSFSRPIAVAIVALMVIVTISYQQTIHAYPSGDAYIVARDNLGELPAQPCSPITSLR